MYYQRGQQQVSVSRSILSRAARCISAGRLRSVGDADVLYADDAESLIQLVDGLLIVSRVWHFLTVIIQKLAKLCPVRLGILIKLLDGIRENGRDEHIVVTGRHSEGRAHQ